MDSKGEGLSRFVGQIWNFFSMNSEALWVLYFCVILPMGFMASWEIALTVAVLLGMFLIPLYIGFRAQRRRRNRDR